jgi:DNA adenine methylase
MSKPTPIWTQDMKISAIAPWFGGKRNLAPEIIRELGSHRAYWEPFCGGLPVLLAKEPATMETVNDLHGDLTNLARIIQHPAHGPELYRRLRRCWMDEELYDQCQAEISGSYDGTLSVDRAFAYFVASWLGRNGTSGLQPHRVGKAFCVRYTKNGGHAGTRFSNAIESIPAWRRRMRGLTILRRDGFELLERIEDAAGVVIYCDPPYIEKSGTYLHDFAATDHSRLAALLGRFKKTRVAVSYYDHPDLSELYPGWTKRTFDVSKAMAHQGSRGENTIRATEVLLINGQSLVAPSDSLVFRPSLVEASL